MSSKGFTLPVWVAATARAATEILTGEPFSCLQTIQISNRKEPLCLEVESASLLSKGNQSLAISHCNSGLGLDLTAGLEVWVLAELKQLVEDDFEADSFIKLVPGFGVGKLNATGDPCVSAFANELLHQNLYKLIPKGFSLRIEVIFPKGKVLSERTSNEAFGVVEGLAIIGTQEHVQDSASSDQLNNALEELKLKCASSKFSGELIFVIGENGLDLSQKLSLSSAVILKTGNWLGPLLVAAAREGVKKLLLFGYHGKLVKLAGGIFHTHNHLADGRIEVLTSIAVREGLPLSLIQLLNNADSVEGALLALEAKDQRLAENLWVKMATMVENRSLAYLGRYGSWSMEIGAALFDRNRRLRWAGPLGLQQLAFFGIKL